MGARQILAELQGEFQKQATLRLATGYSLLVGLMSLLAAWTGGGLETALDVPYLFAPLIVCPVVAHRVLRDREDGKAEVRATTPFPESHVLASRTLAALLLTPALVLVSLPILFAASAATAPGAFLDLLVYPAWAISIGTAAAAAGLLIGYLTPGKPMGGLALSFLTAFAWLIFGLGLGGTPNPPTLFAVVRRLSPLSHAIQASNIGLLPGPIELLLAPLVYAAVALVLLPFVALGLQHPSGWDRPLTDHPLPIAGVLSVLLITATGLVAWTAPEAEATPSGSSFKGYTQDLWLEVDFGYPPPGEGWRQGVPLDVELYLLGPPNGTVRLDEVQLVSDRVTFQASSKLPADLVLDDIFQDRSHVWNDTGGKVGSTRATFTFQAAPEELFESTEAELIVVLDGHTNRFDERIHATRWHVDVGNVWAGFAATTLPLLVATRWLPGRWNRW